MEKKLVDTLYEELKKRNMLEQEDIEDQDENDDESEEQEDDDDETEDDSESNDDFCDMVCNILHSRNQAHVFHLQTKSYSEHKALQNYYEGIDGLVDGVIESYQGKYDVLTSYKSIKTEDYKSSEQVIKYFKALDLMVEKNRKSVKESYIQNQIDTIQELIYSTLYKLRFLK